MQKKTRKLARKEAANLRNSNQIDKFDHNVSAFLKNRSLHVHRCCILARNPKNLALFRTCHTRQRGKVGMNTRLNTQIAHVQYPLFTHHIIVNSKNAIFHISSYSRKNSSLVNSYEQAPPSWNKR